MLEVVVYADANSDTVVLSVTPSSAAITATWEALKPVAKTVPGSSDCQSYVVSADVVAWPWGPATHGEGSVVYHRNGLKEEDSYMTKTLLHTNVKGTIHGYGPDPLMNRTTGAMVARLPQTPASPTGSSAGSPAGSPADPPPGTSTTLAVTVLTANTDTADEFVAAIKAKSGAFVDQHIRGGEVGADGAFPPAAHTAWWAGKWGQHAIEVGPSTNATEQTKRDTAQISRQYVWQRFIELSQARSPYPIKVRAALAAHRLRAGREGTAR